PVSPYRSIIVPPFPRSEELYRTAPTQTCHHRWDVEEVVAERYSRTPAVAQSGDLWHPVLFGTTEPPLVGDTNELPDGVGEGWPSVGVGSADDQIPSPRAGSPLHRWRLRSGNATAAPSRTRALPAHCTIGRLSGSVRHSFRSFDHTRGRGARVVPRGWRSRGICV